MLRTLAAGPDATRVPLRFFSFPAPLKAGARPVPSAPALFRAHRGTRMASKRRGVLVLVAYPSSTGARLLNQSLTFT